ncbi:translation initiation factor eIF3a [Pholiota molesta]|nr:translation initiation factor eIF3a [Pholiota molesta]
MAPFSKPETVLKQAEGLVSVGQTHAALQSLTEMFSSKRFRSTPLTALEPIMHRFIELCVDMRKGRTAKEGLMQYKNIAQNTSVQSIESVVTKFIQLADAKVREAQEKAAVKSAVDIDDLEASETPESILLGAVSGDQSKDRTDRALVTPWLKFLWESYRTSLETLKNNARWRPSTNKRSSSASSINAKLNSEGSAKLSVFTFPMLRNTPTNNIPSTSPTLTPCNTISTLASPMNTSVELELWQEAFRSVEDVHNLLTMAKKAPRPAMMANYYEKLTKIFLMSGNALYHAAAWSRYYAVVISIGGKSDEEISRLAAQVLVSALAVPVGLHTEEPDELKGKNARLRSPWPHSHADSFRIAQGCTLAQAIKSLYNILEVLSTPSPSARPSRPSCKPSPPTRLRALPDPPPARAPLAPPLAALQGAFDAEQVEAYIMGCARRGELAVRVDHQDGSIAFVDDAFSAADDPPASSTAATASARTPEAPCSRRPRSSSGEVPSKEEQARFAALVAAVEGERKALQLRRALEKEESSRRAEHSRREKEEEARRMKEELRRKEQERTKKEIETIRIDEAKKYAQSLVDKGILKPNDVEKLETYDTENLITIQVAQLEKEKKELQERLRIVAKRIDHIERAYRKEERPLLAQDYEVQQKTDRETFAAIQTARITAARAAHEEDLRTKARLARMLGDYELEFAKKQEAAQRKIAEEKAKRLKSVLKQREEERVRLEKEAEAARLREEEEARKQAEREAAEERRRQEEEAALAAEAEAKRKVEEEAAARRAEREKEREEALQKARLQAQREEEAEARRAAAAQRPSPRAPSPHSRPAPCAPPRRRTRACGAAPSPAPVAGKYRPGALGGAGGGWRAKEAAKAAAAEGGTGSPRPSSPAPLKEEAKKDEEGFQTVAGRGGAAAVGRLAPPPWRPP